VEKIIAHAHVLPANGTVHHIITRLLGDSPRRPHWYGTVDDCQCRPTKPNVPRGFVNEALIHKRVANMQDIHLANLDGWTGYIQTHHCIVLRNELKKWHSSLSKPDYHYRFRFTHNTLLFESSFVIKTSR